jgi:type III pantothenate kinase
MLKKLIPKATFSSLEGAIICSVVPGLTGVYEKAIITTLGLKPVIVHSGLKLGIKIRYKNAAQVGVDRLANAVAAHKIYKGPAIVVDLGTATTFDVISAKGDFLGGAIAPGIGASGEDLFYQTSQLPRVALQVPVRALGKTTQENLLSGIIFGAVGQINFILEKIQKELRQKCKVVATGGYAPLIWKISPSIQKLDLNLTLKGLCYIFHGLRSKTKI